MAKLCKDCAYFVDLGNDFRCKHPKANYVKEDLVTGRKQAIPNEELAFCNVQRIGYVTLFDEYLRLTSWCGTNAVWFEKRKD